jgi:hypothetical protein
MKIKTLTNPSILKRFPGQVRSKASNPDPGSRPKYMITDHDRFKIMPWSLTMSVFWNLDPHSSPLGSHWSRETTEVLVEFQKRYNAI